MGSEPQRSDHSPRPTPPRAARPPEWRNSRVRNLKVGERPALRDAPGDGSEVLEHLPSCPVRRVERGLGGSPRPPGAPGRDVEVSIAGEKALFTRIHNVQRISSCGKNKGTAWRNKVHGVAMEEGRRAAGVGDVHVLTLSTKLAAASGVFAALSLQDHL